MDDKAKEADEDGNLAAGRLEQQIALLDRIQQQGHVVTNGRELRTRLVQLLDHLWADQPGA
ncbi:hypothetical protein B0G76_8636 [Paraburkholderia sp. BL23I1N1]|uniref:hypothetical protein n=1 Tax=Paraburkholderia sp. BL23I1N1 TaxID=1938802 RepID=UPI000FEFC600|nr:hypothetical protein [Paraburkholderia sp. BL23I1N1]RKE23936.1 hypothetical protein B0G76_8636 [Paraburkholderia sp. BL23I1N1]